MSIRPSPKAFTSRSFPARSPPRAAPARSGMAIVAGAPNYLRGGSQSGNVAVKDLLAEGLVDMFASDYVPRSLLDAAFRLAADPALPHDLPAAIALVTEAPARAAGLPTAAASPRDCAPIWWPCAWRATNRWCKRSGAKAGRSSETPGQRTRPP
jgi:hypothetical protein